MNTKTPYYLKMPWLYWYQNFIWECCKCKHHKQWIRFSGVVPISHHTSQSLFPGEEAQSVLPRREGLPDWAMSLRLEVLCMSLMEMSSIQAYFKKSKWRDGKNQAINQKQLYAEQQKVFSLASGDVKNFSPLCKTEAVSYKTKYTFLSYRLSNQAPLVFIQISWLYSHKKPALGYL